MFDAKDIDMDTLRKRAFNLRWAEVPDDVIPLTAADPDLKCSPEIVKAIKNYVDKQHFSYGPAEGLPEFKESVSQLYLDQRAVEYSHRQILPVDSAAFGIHLVCKTILNPGDEAIIFDPVDFLFKYSILDVGAIPISFEIPVDTCDVDFREMEKLVTKKTKLVCLCNPLNPTGKVFTRQELETLIVFVKKHNLLILSDEIWSDIIFAPHNYTSVSSISEEAKSRTYIVDGFSKSYGIAGLRTGIIIAPDQNKFDELLKVSLHNSTVHGANTIGQIAATAAIQNGNTWLKLFVEHLHRMRAIVVDEVNSIPQLQVKPPEGCYVGLIDIRKTGMSSLEFQKFALEQARVAVVPGLEKWFGSNAEGYVRISFATTEEILREAINRLKLSL